VSTTESWIPGHEELGGGVLGFIDRVLCWIVAGGLLAMSGILMIQVIARYVANAPTVWSEELAISIFVWVAMLAIPLGLRRGEHLTLDIISKRLKPAANKMLSVVIAVLIIVTLAAIAYFAIRLVPAADRQLLAGIAGGLGIQAKVSWVYLAVPVGFSFGILFTVDRLIALLRGKVSVLNADADQAIIDALEADVASDAVLPSPGAHDSSNKNTKKDEN
jgi:TRAP-type C4-dicarboxylate transport system permease small subunit